MATDLTIELLRDIRGGIRELREDFNARLDQAVERLDRVERGLNDLGTFMRQIALDQARHERFHSHHVERLDEDVSDLKVRVGRLEERGGT